MQAIADVRGTFVAPRWPDDLDAATRKSAHAIYVDALNKGIRVVMGLAGVLALAGAVCGAVSAPPRVDLRKTKDLE
jgi:hypothetical protein